MLTLNELNDEIRYFESLDVAVSAYKSMAEGKTDSFYQAVKKQKRTPLINYIHDSDVLLSLDVLRVAVTRKLFALAVREQENFIDFEKIQNEQNYIEVRDRILKSHPALTMADCNKILRQICNAISHGDISSSFNFKEYEKRVNDIYSMCRTLSPKNNSLTNKFFANELVETYYLGSNLKFKYETFYEFMQDGTKVKRDKRVKIELNLTEDDIIPIVNLILDYTLHQKIFNSILDNDMVSEEKGRKILANPNGENPLKLLPQLFDLDDIQQEAYNNLKKEFLQTFMSISKFLNNTNPDDVKNVFMDTLASFSALHSVSFGEKYNFLKVNRIIHIIDLLPIGVEDSKRTFIDILSHNLGQDFKMFNDEEKIHGLIPYVEYLEGDKFYKELLMMQVSTMLQDIEQNSLKRKVGTCQAVQQIAKDFYEKEEFDDKEIIKIIDNIRDALVHGTYINNSEDEIEIYDQISKTDKTLEYKFTVYTSDLEEIKNYCLIALKSLKAVLQPTIVTTNKETEKTK